MRSTRFPIDTRYFAYRLMWILPYAAIMTVISVIIALITGTFTGNSYYFSESWFIFGSENFMIPGLSFMYIYPVLIGISLFSFTHKKDAADLFFAAPVRKSAYFLTNSLVAAVVFASMLLITMLSSVFAVRVFKGDNISVLSASSFISVFFFLFLGYMLIYTVTAAAATFTGTVPAQLFAAAVMLFVPMALLMTAEIPLLRNFSNIFEPSSSYTIFGTSYSDIIVPPNIAAFPITLIYLGSTNWFDAYGLFSRLTTLPAFLYTLFLIAVFTYIGILCFRRYKIENVEKAFANEKVDAVFRAAFFIPILTGFFFIVNNQAMDIFGMAVLIITTLITIAYIVVDLILRKGVKGFGKSLLVYACIFVFSVVVGGLVLASVSDAIGSGISPLSADDVDSVTIYLEPLNITPTSDEVNLQHLVPVKITDSGVISKLFETSDNNSGLFWMEFTSDKGKALYYVSISAETANSIYAYIDANADIKKSLIKYPGTDRHVHSYTLLASEQSRGNVLLCGDFTNMSTAAELISERERYILETPTKQLYEEKSLNGFSSSYYEYSDSILFDNDDETEIKIAEIKYADGMYYVDLYSVSGGTELFESVFKANAATASGIVTNSEKADYGVIGALNCGDAQILNLKGILAEMPKLIPDKFRETVIAAADKPLIYNNSVILSVADGEKRGFFILNIDRDIEPLLSAYADALCEKIGTGGMSYYIILCIQYDAPLAELYGSEIQEAGKEFVSMRERIRYYLTEKFTSDTVPRELFWCTEGLNAGNKTLSFMIDGAFTSATGDYYSLLKESRISEIKAFTVLSLGEEVTVDSGELFDALKQSLVLSGSLTKYYAYESGPYVNSVVRQDTGSLYTDLNVVYGDGTSEMFYGVSISRRVLNMIYAVQSSADPTKQVVMSDYSN